MRKKKGATDHDEELEQWIVEARTDCVSQWAPALETSLGVRLSAEDVWLIAVRAKDYVEIHRESSKQRAWRKACKRVAKSAEDFKKAVENSAEYYGNLINAWQKEPAADKALMRVQRLATKHHRPRENRKPKDTPLRSLIAAVLEASHNAGREGLGIMTDTTTGKLAGPVLDAVKASLRLAGLPEADMPGNSTIRMAAREVDREGK